MSVLCAIVFGGGTVLPSKAEAELTHLTDGAVTGSIQTASISPGKGAKGDYSVAIGGNAVAYGHGAVAFGNSMAGWDGTGTEPAANYGTYAFAAGNENVASGDYSVAMGNKNIASGSESVAMGNKNTASETASVAMGIFNNASGMASVAMGIYTNAKGMGSGAFGFGGIDTSTGSAKETVGALGDGSFVTGGFVSFDEETGPITNPNTASGRNAVAMGEGNTASGIDSMAVGWGNQATGAGSFVAGGVKSTNITTSNANIASGINAIAMGEGNIAGGNDSVAIGYGNNNKNGTASTEFGDYSVAMGYENKASGGASVAMGDSNTADGTASVAMGNGNTASGEGSVAIGCFNTASGAYSMAMGGANTASGEGSVAMGAGSTASGVGSVAMGQSATATPDNSFAFGGTVNTGATSGVALGYQSSVATNAANSVALGAMSVAKNSYEVSVGYYNSSTDYLTRKITNVAAGTADTDAVNYSQLKGAYTSAAYSGTTLTLTKIDGTQTQLTIGGGGGGGGSFFEADGNDVKLSTQSKITNVAAGTNAYDAVNYSQLKNLEGRLTQDIGRTGAASAALASLHPQMMRKGESQVMAGMGRYHGKSGAAVGLAWQPHKKVMLSGGFADAAGEIMFNVGASYLFGQRSYTKAELAELNSGAGTPLYVAELNADLKSKDLQIMNLKSDNAAIKAELAELKAIVAELIKAKK